MFTTSNLIESWKISWFDEAQAKFMKSRMEPRKGALRMIYSCKVMQHCHWSFDYVKKYKRNAFLWEDKTKALKSDSLCKFLNIFIIIPSFIEKRRKKNTISNAYTLNCNCISRLHRKKRRFFPHSAVEEEEGNSIKCIFFSLYTVWLRNAFHILSINVVCCSSHDNFSCRWKWRRNF